ncbi:MAG: TetR family transcriptional regulator [Proteobacteria bacterium]|nr:TetR family transcriptional regulator [Pseudomonadota bacterium]
MIIQAAGRVLADKGYTQTTVSQVAAAAGVSRGLLHYYFKNKEELLTRVIEANVIFSLGLIEAVFTASDSAAALAQNMVAALRGVTLHQPYFFALFQEFLALARAKPAIAEKLAEFYRLFRQRLSEELTGAARRGVVAAGEDHEPRAAMLTALIDGLGLQLASDPDLARRDELWTEAVRVIRAVIDGR